MAFIQLDKPLEKMQIKITVDKTLALEFEKELQIFKEQNALSIVLNFDKFASKLVTELKAINKLQKPNIVSTTKSRVKVLVSKSQPLI